MKTKLLVLLIILLIASCPDQIWARLQIPKNLSTFEQEKLLETLGPTAGSKLLGDPYPLGGYPGYELSFSQEQINVHSLSGLGQKTESQSAIGFYTLTIGKGLYNNIDFFLEFSPTNQQDEFSHYGGQIRWLMANADYWSSYLTAIIHASSTSYQNLVQTSTQGLDFVIGFNLEETILFMGSGLSKSQGIFMGGEASITESKLVTQSQIQKLHFFGGTSLQFKPLFLAFQVDYFDMANYSAKLGFRY